MIKSIHNVDTTSDVETPIKHTRPKVQFMLINDMISKFLNVQSQNANKNKNLKRNEMKWDACYIENLNFVSLWHSNDKP